MVYGVSIGLLILIVFMMIFTIIILVSGNVKANNSIIESDTIISTTSIGLTDSGDPSVDYQPDQYWFSLGGSVTYEMKDAEVLSADLCTVNTQTNPNGRFILQTIVPGNTMDSGSISQIIWCDGEMKQHRYSISSGDIRPSWSSWETS